MTTAEAIHVVSNACTSEEHCLMPLIYSGKKIVMKSLESPSTLLGHAGSSLYKCKETGNEGANKHVKKKKKIVQGR